MSNHGSRANGSSGVSETGSAGRQQADPRRGENQPVPGAGAAPDGVVRHRIHLSGGVHAVPGARAAIDLLTVELFEELRREEIRLMVSELVSNSVRHGGAWSVEDDIELTVFVNGKLLRVECSDPRAGFDVPAARSGFGLSIIDELASAWGVRHGALGSTWFDYARAG